MQTKAEDVHEYVSSEESESLSVALSRDQELNEMKMIIDEMADNYASDYEQYPQVIGDKASISDSLIIDVLKQYVNPCKHEDEDSDRLVLETDTNPIHIQVIQEIEDGIPMQFDQIPKSATPRSFKTTRGRKRKQTIHNKLNKDVEYALKTPENMPSIHQSHSSSDLPPPYVISLSEISGK